MLAWTRSPDQVNAGEVRGVHLQRRRATRSTTRRSRCWPVTRRATSTSCRRRSSRAPSSTTPSFGIPQNDVNYVVNLDFNGDATKIFADVTRAIVGTKEQFAIVLDGMVLSAPGRQLADHRRQRRDQRQLHRDSAKSLANSLKYGALPLKFEVPVVTEEGPTLAADQLSAGLLAGAIGLALVMIYCLLYYRGLGIVVVASLLVAAAVTYAAVLFLSENAGFTLTLPGIAGLIVAVGITADSFIVYFERIRDEMREGKTLRVAVEAGWARARNDLCGRGRGVAAGRGRALHLRDRRREGLRVRARHQHGHRPRRVLPVHQADGDLAGPVQVLRHRPQVVRAVARPHRHRADRVRPTSGARPAGGMAR